MGTRHLIAVQIDREYRIAQYGQWDGGPAGQGVNILSILREMEYKDGFEAFKKKIRATRWITDKELEIALTSVGSKDRWMSIDQAMKWQTDYPQLCRDTGATILKIVLDQPEGIGLINSIGFAGDSLVCEFAYVVDFDKGTFEVYRGFNREPLDESERFFHLTRDDEYAPVKLWKTYKLDNLPNEDEFLADLREKDNE